MRGRMRGSRGLTAALAVTAAAGVIGAGTLLVNAMSGQDTASNAPEGARRPAAATPSAPDGGTRPGAGTPDGRGGTASAGGADYLVFCATGKKDEAVKAVEAAGGVPGADNAALGYLVVRRAPKDFAEKAGESPAVVGVTANSRIGATAQAARRARTLPDGGPRHAPILDLEPMTGRAAKAAPVRLPGVASPRRVEPEPLAAKQWDMKMVGATAARSYATAPGDKKVLVGIIDTGIDGKHPDIAPNFDRELSRNFVVDMPKDPNGETVDGPCEVSSCKDPVDVDDDGHGTHVAGTVASPINGFGIAGVAPEVTLVNLRAGQDSGFFFLKPSMDALTYAGDNGIDVVNMSFYIDPWLFNCPAAAGDSRTEQLEQAGIIIGMQRALDYARERGVTLISAMGNGATDLGKIVSDATSPDFPKNAERQRRVSNSCLSTPTEARGVISVSAVGPSGRKAYYSDYGIEQTDVSAPGGDTSDATTGLPPAARGILAPAPEGALRASGKIGADGAPGDDFVVRECRDGRCAYFQYLEGTSMAAPHATGVAAILISRFGEEGKEGFTMDPAKVEELLYDTATERPCPTPRAVRFPDDTVQVCEGDRARNGFYGRGLVDAARAATVSR